MTVLFDAGSKKFVSNGPVLTQAHTCNGSDRVLVVALSSADNDYMVAGAITYAGVSLGTPVLTQLGVVGNVIRLYVLVNPPAGTANIVVTPSQATYLNLVAASYTGVNQAAPVSASNTFYDAYAVAPVSTTITTPVGGMAVSALLQYGLTGGLSCDASQTLVDISADLFGRLGMSHKADATAMAWTPTPDFKNATQLVVALSPVAAGGTNATALGATLTGTGTLTPGSAVGGGAATGSFTTKALANNTGAGIRANTAVFWEWRTGPGIGVAPTRVVYGSGTTDAQGRLVAPGLPLGAGRLDVETTDRLHAYAVRGVAA